MDLVQNLEEHHMLYLQNLITRHLQNTSVCDHLSMNKTMKVCLDLDHRNQISGVKYYDQLYQML